VGIAAAHTGEDLTTGFNPQFLLDGLTALDGEYIDLSFTQASKPVVISSTDAGDADSFRYLLMPRRLLS
jgi:DNA polymerase-3 subunit beta